MIPMPVILAFQFIMGFFRDGTNSSMSRLIAFGGANIMAIYLLADIVDRHTGCGKGMNEAVMLACVYTLGALGGVAYIANKTAEVKKAQAGEPPSEPVQPG